MTSSIRTGTRSILAAALLVAGTLACGGKSSSAPLAGDLLGDLEAAKSSSIELANEGARRTQVVSAEELTAVPGAGRERAIERVPLLKVRKAKVGNKPTLAPAPAPPASATVLAPTPDGPVMDADTLRPIGARPTPAPPAATPSRRGGYKSVGDVIRDAPFPINP